MASARAVRGVLVLAMLGALVAPLIGAQPAAAVVICGGRTATLMGNETSDILNGTPGPDVMVGLGGDDVIKGAGGDDYICGGPGADTILGGPGSDWVSFDDATTGGEVDLAAGTAGIQGADKLAGIENARGGPGADAVRGNGLGNHLIIGDLDTVEGRGGDDVLGTAIEDADGHMTVSYESAMGPVSVDVDSGMTTGAAGTDSFSFPPHGIIGSSFGDRLSCSRVVASCSVVGGRGNDVISGTADADVFRGDSGDDRIVGKEGPDLVRYDGSAAVAVNLSTGIVTGQGRDTLMGIEGAVGSSAADVIVGGNLPGCFLDGARGNDVVVAGTASCAVSGGPGDDRLTGSRAADLIAPDGEGTPGNDTIMAGAGNDYVFGDEGDDMLDGGPGVDTAAYGSTVGSLNADLATGVVTGAGADVVRSFENLDGTSGPDTLHGTAGRNVINGGLGNDAVYGDDGHDVLSGGDGRDTMYGGAGDDRMSGDRGDDTLFGGPDRDIVFFRYGYPSVSADLVTGVAASAGSGTDDILEFEDIFGTEGNDILRGDTGPNFIEGGAGIDACEGRGGADILHSCP
jgi:Ca2+-binding RTX toxin-like protein